MNTQNNNSNEYDNNNKYIIEIKKEKNDDIFNRPILGSFILYTISPVLGFVYLGGCIYKNIYKK